MDVGYSGAYEVPANESENENGFRAEAYWLVKIQWKSRLQDAGTHFWINANTQRIKSDPYASFFANFPKRHYYGNYTNSQPELGFRPAPPTQRRVLVKAIASAIFKDIVTQWNALPKTKPDQK